MSVNGFNAIFSLSNRKLFVSLLIVSFLLMLKTYLDNDILQTDVEILLNKTISLQKELKRLSAQVNVPVELAPQPSPQQLPSENNDQVNLIIVRDK